MECGRKYLESAIADAIRLGQVAETDAIRASKRVYSVFQGMLVEAKVQNNLDILRDLEATVLGIIGAHSQVSPTI